ncbi:MAG: phosphotransferase family protein [Deltaproteobacteria bacterium]|nr:phosphotransferase family protein [Deltaproteobacteria bacterium]MBW2418257.1 phosphotransferase family protein [Deltaproteobacteria bacterium]
MTSGKVRDPGLVKAALERWLPEALGVEAAELVGLEKPSGSGFSNETFVFDVRYHSEGREQTRGFALQAAPLGEGLFPEYDMLRMFHLQTLVGDHSQVPVAPMVACHIEPELLGAPFYLMERVAGRVPTDNPSYHAEGWLHDASPEDQAAAWWSAIDALVKLRSIDPETTELAFLEKGWQKPGVAAKLASWEHFMGEVVGERSAPLLEEGLARLKDRLPEEGPAGITWGDAKPGNIIYQGTRAAALLDWELASLGPPEEDLVHWIFIDRFLSEGLHVERLPHLPGREETLARYQEQSGHEPRDVDWWELYSAWRLAVIIYRIMCIYKRLGLLPDEADPYEVNVAKGLLGTILEGWR